MEYQEPPTLCVRSIEPAETTGRFMLDMPSLWTDDGPVEVSQETIDYVTVDPHQVPTCPPGYPNEAETESNNTKSRYTL